MPWALTLVLLAGLLAVDPAGLDPAVVKLPVLLAGTSLALAASACRRRHGELQPLDPAVLALGLWTLLSSALAAWPGRFPEALQGLALAGAWYWLGRRELRGSSLTRLLGALALVAAASLLLELGTRPPWAPIVGMGWRSQELVGCLANPNLTASAVLLGGPSAVLVWGWPAALLCLAGLAGTLSRGAWLGALAGAGAWLGSRPAGLAWRPLAGTLAAALLVLALGTTTGRLRPGQVLEGRTLRARLDLARLFGEAAGDQPATGWGPGRAGVAFAVVAARRGRPETLADRQENAHNPLLQRAVEGGVPAALSSLLLLVALVRRLPSRLRSAAPGPALGLVAMMVAESVGVGLETPFLMALAAATWGGVLSPDVVSPDEEAPGGGARSPLAGLLALVLLAGVPGAATRAQAERARRAIRGLGPDGRALHPPADLPDRLPSPELRYDAAGVLALERQLDLARARWLVLESGYPDYGSSRDNRRQVRELQQGRLDRPMGPARPDG